jgi:hypothetical protein
MKSQKSMKYSDEITEIDGIMFNGAKIIIPKATSQNAAILLIGMQISSHKHSQAGWPGCRDECSKMLSCKLFLTTVKTIST